MFDKVVDLNDIRVVQLCKRPRLLPKATHGGLVLHQLARQEFDRDLTLLARINPNVELVPHAGRLTGENAEAVFGAYDMVLDGSDIPFFALIQECEAEDVHITGLIFRAPQRLPVRFEPS